MINAVMEGLGKKRSVIREIFEYGKARKQEIGEENVFDFSIGNPSVPAPACVNETLHRLIEETDSVELHGYTSAQGDATVRKVLADYTNARFGTSLTADCFYLTCGAAASLSITLKALCCPGDEVLTFAPYFPEYKLFVEAAGAVFRALPSEAETFQIDFDRLEQAIGPQTKAILINSPNNPSGAVYSEETILRLAALLRKRQAAGQIIYLIADEPYRELVYGDVKVPYVMAYYDRSLVCYSYSKSLSLPGERIGYIAVNNAMAEWQDVYAAICGAGRALGYVCAPSLFQRLVAACVDKTADVSEYEASRNLLMEGLKEFGYTYVKPDGAFYLFVKALEADAVAFCERAKQFELLLVPSDDFGCPGYVRVAYCVSPDMIARALPAFAALAKAYAKGQ